MRHGPALMVLALCLLPLTAPAARAAGRSASGGGAVPARDGILGRGYLRLQFARADFGGSVSDVWGVDTERYLGLEGGWGWGRDLYFSAAIGRIAVGTARDQDGNVLQDVAFHNVEINTRVLFDLKHGLSFGMGGGMGAFQASGTKTDALGSVDLDDIGFGYQALVGFNWRVRRFVAGAEVEYQVVSDISGIDYSNLRLGGSLGIVF